MTSMSFEQMNAGTFMVKDPISALTHFIGMILAVLAMPVLLVHHAQNGAALNALCADAVFMISMILLYGASSAYHTFDTDQKVRMKLKKLDHMSIFILIAGSYTPICVSVLEHPAGMILLAVVWSVAAAGMIFKFCWVTCPRWVSSVLYTAMGWACVSVIPKLISGMPLNQFLWLLAGGIFYSAGSVIYAKKKRITPMAWSGFGNHELFHIFVMLGSFCHFTTMMLIRF